MLNDDVKQSSAGVGFQVGSKIGKYEVREKLGIGGQAIVYKCYDPTLDRFVAIKQISAHLAEDPRFMDRFRKEAQILARLGSEQPAIVTIYELIENEYGLFIVMEYVPGHSLETVLKDTQGPVEAKATLQILWRLAAALHVVHQAGIIHRDIKPSNIIISEGLRSKITDFGVAASSSGQTSMLLGTTKYMAPELFSGTVMDGRADMYSLGFIAYEMLIGREKFNEIFSDVVRDRHSESLRWMKWHGSDQVTAPPAHEVNPAVPPALGMIVAKMMSKDPNERYESMEALGRAIKMAFSPKGKAAAAARGPVAPPARGRAGAAPVTALAEKGTLAPLDEGDELEVAPENNPTAPIPKKRLSRKTKFILLGAVITSSVIGLTVMAILQSQKDADLKRSAASLLAHGHVQFKDKKYAPARETYQAVITRFANSRESIEAAMMGKTCEVYLCLEDKKYQDALKAKQELDALIKDALRNEAVAEFAKKLQTREGEALDYMIRGGWGYDTEIATVKKMITDGQSPQALERLDEMARKLRLTREQLDEIQKIKAGILQSDATARLMDASRRVAKAMEDKKYDDAQVAMRDVEELLNSQETGRMVAAATIAAVRKQLQDAKSQISTLDEENRIYSEIGKARAEGKKAEEIQWIDKALARKADAGLAARKKQLEMELDYGQITDALQLNEEPRAITLLGPFIEKWKGLYEDNALTRNADKLLATLKNKALLEGLKAEADKFFEQKDYAKALEKYNAAIELRSDEQMAERADRCKFKIDEAKADAGRSAATTIAAKEKSLADYETLRQNFSKYGAELEARISALKNEIQYDKALAAAKEDLERGNYDKARTALQKIQPQTPEVKELFDRAYFRQQMWLGKRALDLSQADAAIGYGNIARGRARTPEERAEAQRLIDEATDLKGRQEKKTP